MPLLPEKNSPSRTARPAGQAVGAVILGVVCLRRNALFLDGGWPAVTELFAVGSTASAVLVEQRGELLRREDPVALDHELTDLLPVRVVGERYHDAITSGSRGEERVANGQQRVALLWVGPQH